MGAAWGGSRQSIFVQNAIALPDPDQRLDDKNRIKIVTRLHNFQSPEGLDVARVITFEDELQGSDQPLLVPLKRQPLVQDRETNEKEGAKVKPEKLKNDFFLCSTLFCEPGPRQMNNNGSEPIKLLTNVEKLRLLTKAEKAGLLTAAENFGLSLSTVERLGLLSKAEELGVLSAATDPATPGTLLSISLALLVLGPVCVFVVPEQYPWEVALQIIVALSGPRVARLDGGPLLRRSTKTPPAQARAPSANASSPPHQTLASISKSISQSTRSQRPHRLSVSISLSPSLTSPFSKLGFIEVAGLAFNWFFFRSSNCRYPWKNLFVTPAASGQRRVPYQLHQFFAAAFGSNATEV
ncbi:hypothetical protein GW17_00027540 [Ensete ventricosum]|nr:hypothetical protein GW17_00027540 [Ensete ventricosum]RZR76576.1 hypothetical protein BHM03_00001402 [Ensete ventricosum]